MLKFATRYFKALAALLLAMGLYRLVVVPITQPGVRTATTIPENTRPLGGERWWQDFFPPGSWQTQNPKIIYTDRGILLTNNWAPLSPETPETWKLERLAMILPQSEAARQAIRGKKPELMAEQDMWIVIADEGATIHFDAPPDFTSGSVPKVLRGDLAGAIEITRRVAADVEDKPWRLRTFDLTIDHRQVSTQREVLIEWNDSIIQGHELRIMLRGDLLGSQGTNVGNWGPLDELELYHVDKIDIALPPGGLWSNFESQEFKEHPELRTLPARLSATCGGRFSFDFKSSTATLQDGVHVLHHLGTLPADEFLCAAVSFVVEPLGDSPSDNTDMAGFKLKDFEATGMDSLQEFVGEKWVEMRAPTINASARAKQLKVDFEKQRVQMAGRIDQPGATQSTVRVNYQGNEILSPRIEYQAAPATDAQSSRHLGWMFAEGPGELRTSSDSAFGEVQVRWQTTLKMAPSPESEERQWIELTGNALVESKQRGFLATDRLEVWLSRNGEANLGVSAMPPGVSDPSMAYVPDRLYASGQTLVATAELRAQVAELDMTLLVAPSAPSTTAIAPGQMSLSDSAGNPMYQWVTPPGKTEPGVAASSPANSANSSGDASEASDPSSVAQPAAQVGVLPGVQPAVQPIGPIAAAPSPGPIASPGKTVVPAQPIGVLGQKLTARIVSSGDENWIDHLQISGPVKVWREEDAQAQTLPWQILGDQLRLSTNRTGQVDMQIDGLPAKVLVAEGLLESASIRVDQAHNLLWMNQPGEFTIPLSVLNVSQKPGEPSIEWLKAPHCRWQGKMVFDGSIATIEGNIAFDAAFRTAPDQLWLIEGKSQQLSLNLAQPLDLNAIRGEATTELEIERVVLTNNVNIFATQIDPLGNKKSQEQIAVPRLTFHVAQSQVVGSGPGWIKSKHPSKGQLGQLASADAVKPQAGLQASHLNFRDSMVGFLDRNEVVFDGKVELAASPIGTWEDTIDISSMQRLSPGQMLLNCDQLKVYDTSDLSTVNSLNPTSLQDQWEFQATGNVAFRGKADSGDYSGKGYQATYVQAKDLLYLRGDERDSAYCELTPAANANIAGGRMYLDYAAINPKIPSIRELKIGEGGVLVDMDKSPGAATRPSAPPTAPDPRQDFYKRNRQ